MEKNKTIYVLYTCNTHKDRSTMRIRLCTTNVFKLKDCILDGLRYGVFDYAYNDSKDINEWIRDFTSHFDTCIQENKIQDIGMFLDGGLIEQYQDGVWD